MTEQITESSKTEWQLAIEGYIDKLFEEIEALTARIASLETAVLSRTTGV